MTYYLTLPGGWLAIDKILASRPLSMFHSIALVAIESNILLVSWLLFFLSCPGRTGGQDVRRWLVVVVVVVFSVIVLHGGFRVLPEQGRLPLALTGAQDAAVMMMMMMMMIRLLQELLRLQEVLRCKRCCCWFYGRYFSSLGRQLQ